MDYQGENTIKFSPNTKNLEKYYFSSSLEDMLLENRGDVSNLK